MNHRTLAELFESWQNDEIDGNEFARLLRERDEYEKNNAARLREHRRYEIARDCTAAIMMARTSMTIDDAIKACVNAADLLLAELEKQQQEKQK